MPAPPRNNPPLAPRRRSALAPRAGLSLALTLAAALGACRTPARETTVTLEQLERAAPARVLPLGSAVLADPAALEPSYHALNGRMGFYALHTPEDLARLHALAPHLPLPLPPPGRGLVVALASRIGTPLHERWPVRLRAARTVHGGALVEGRFAGGSYLLDGLTFIDAAYVPDATDVLVVEINGVKFMPQ